MASFDIIQASSFGYRFVWREREHLAWLAAVPVFIKFICHITVVMLGWNEQFMRQGLVMLPSYLADGWMLSHMVRLMFFGQRWPFRTTGNPEADMAALQVRAKGIMAGTFAYALVKLIVAGAADVVYQLNLSFPPVVGGPVVSIGAVAGVMILFSGLWLFRFFWFFIPAALDYPLYRYAKDVRGLKSSVYLLGLWVGCVFPILVIFGFMLMIVLAVLGAAGVAAESGHLPLPMEAVAAFIRVVADTITACVSTAAVGYALHVVVGRK